MVTEPEYPEKFYLYASDTKTYVGVDAGLLCFECGEEFLNQKNRYQGSPMSNAEVVQYKDTYLIVQWPGKGSLVLTGVANETTDRDGEEENGSLTRGEPTESEGNQGS